MGEVAVKTLDWVPLAKAIGALPHYKQATVNEVIDKARGYVWGWEDARGEWSPDASWNFPILYGWHYYRFTTEQRTSAIPIRAAFEKFCRGEEF